MAVISNAHMWQKAYTFLAILALIEKTVTNFATLQRGPKIALAHTHEFFGFDFVNQP